MARLPDPERRQALLGAAESAFLELGFEAASLRGIAERAGVPVAGIYTYLRDKDALFEAVVAPLTDLVDEALRAAELDLPRTVADAMDPERRMANALSVVHFAHKHRSHILLLAFRSGGSSLARWIDDVVDRLVALDIAGARWLGAHAPHRLPERPAAWLVRAGIGMQVRSLVDWLQEGLGPRELEHRAAELARYVSHANEYYLRPAAQPRVEK